MEGDEGMGMNKLSKLDVAVNDGVTSVLEETSKDEVNSNEVTTDENIDVIVWNVARLNKGTETLSELNICDSRVVVSVGTKLLFISITGEDVTAVTILVGAGEVGIDAVMDEGSITKVVD